MGVVLELFVELPDVYSIHECMVYLDTNWHLREVALAESLPPGKLRNGMSWMHVSREHEGAERHSG